LTYLFGLRRPAFWLCRRAKEASSLLDNTIKASKGHSNNQALAQADNNDSTAADTSNNMNMEVLQGESYEALQSWVVLHPCFRWACMGMCPNNRK